MRLLRVQPTIPRTQGPKGFLAWNFLDPQSRKLIMLTVENVRGTTFKARSRYKIQYGQWEDLGNTLQNILYQTDWRRVLEEDWKKASKSTNGN